VSGIAIQTQAQRELTLHQKSGIDAESHLPGRGRIFKPGFYTFSTGAEVSSFNRQPQAYSLSLFRVRLRLTVKRVLPMDLWTSVYENRHEPQGDSPG